jgi:hypothetical protein
MRLPTSRSMPASTPAKCIRPWPLQEPEAAAAGACPVTWSNRQHALDALIAADPVLQALYSDQAFILEVGEEVRFPLQSQLLKTGMTWHTLAEGDKVRGASAAPA